MKCKKCQEPVKYITSFNGVNVYVCDPDAIEIINGVGRMVKGYPLHECKKGVVDVSEENNQAD